MDWQQILTAALIVLVFVSFLREWLPPDLVAMGALIILLLVGILDEESLPFVFGRGAPITVACMFILSAAMERTGLIEAMGQWFGKVAGTGETRILVVLVLVVAPLSAFVNNTPVVVVFMPILLQICRKADLKASRFLIPLSYFAIAGGTCTLIGTSTNILAGNIASAEGLRPFTMFEMSKLGIVFVFITGLYVLTFGRKLLPDRLTLSTLFDSAEMREFLTQGMIGPDSNLIGKKFTGTPLAKMRNVRIIEVIRHGERLRTSLKELKFEEGDLVLLKSRVAGMMEISESDRIDLELGLDRVKTESAMLMEGIVGPGSRLVGKTVKQLHFRQRYGVIIMAVHRRGVNLRDRFEDVELAFGDTLLVEGPVEAMNRLFEERDFVNLSVPQQQSLRRRKAPFALGAVAMFMIFGSLAVQLGVPIVAFALAAVFIVLASRCVDPKEAYDSVEWKVIFMIFGMLGLGQAMQVTGLAANVALWAEATFGGYPPWVMVSVIYLLAAVLTELISNNAVATLLTPLAIVVGHQMGVDPRAFVVAVMFGSSASFSTPVGYQTNTYVYGAGGYKFSDFPKVGIPLAVILWVTASFLIPWMWPLKPLTGAG